MRLRRGQLSEWLAAALLVAKGYRILERRFRCRRGEIDIIARRGRRLAFVEVKRRPTMEEAQWSLTAAQERRILDAADVWIERHPSLAGLDRGMDLILIAPRRLPRHLHDAIGAPWPEPRRR